MGTAGDLRALVTAAPAGLRTLRGALTTWVQRDLVAAAHARRPALAPGSPPGDQGPEVLASWYVVVAPPDRWRVVGRGHLAVSDGERSWVGTSTLVTERPPTRASIHDGGVVGSCIHPAPLLEGLELGAPADDEIEGRPCWVVRARPADPAARAGPQPLLHRDLAGVEHRLWFDRATGIMLRHEGYAAGRMCSWLALTDLVVDAPVDDREFRPPPGAVVRSHHELLRDHLAGMGIDPDTVDLDDPVQVRAALRQGA
ncbi:MAG TPA: hypothetical protein VKZ72_02585 [Acidimicrobiales bacterium]|nr:hypothetical protein [Acidimicrobiales bacterium]